MRVQMVADRYRPLGELGRGGMGVVYLARDERTGGTVALKRLALGPAVDPTLRARFVREADAMARVRHPNVVAIRDRGQDEHGPWLVMDHCAGGSLGERLRDGALAVPAVRAVAGDMLDALAAVHAAGLVHRDVKPGNILAHDGRWLLSDFGIARETTGQATALTGTGLLIGTPEYLAPEHLEEGTPGAPADLYALGCVLHEALTGRPPFSASNPLRAAMLHVSEPPPGLPAPVREADPALADLIAEVLRKAPDGRPTAAAAAGALGRALHSPTLVMPAPDGRTSPAPTLVMTRPPRRGGRRALAAAGVAVVLAGGGAAAWISGSGDGDGDGLGPGPSAVEVTSGAPATAPASDPVTAPGTEPAAPVPGPTIDRPAAEEPPAAEPAPEPVAPADGPGRAAPGAITPPGLPTASPGIPVQELAAAWGAPDRVGSTGDADGDREEDDDDDDDRGEDDEDRDRRDRGDRADEAATGTTLTAWDALGVVAVGDPVESFHVTDGEWATPEGITLGTRVDDLRFLLGERLMRVQVPGRERRESVWDGRRHYYLTDGSRAMGFAIHEDRVAEITSAPAAGMDERMRRAGQPR